MPTPTPEEARAYVGDSELAVVAAELRSLKPGRAVYERRTPGLFFLSSKEEALSNTEQRLAEAEKKAAAAEQPKDSSS